YASIVFRIGSNLQEKIFYVVINIEILNFIEIKRNQTKNFNSYHTNEVSRNYCKNSTTSLKSSKYTIHNNREKKEFVVPRNLNFTDKSSKMWELIQLETTINLRKIV
uniref:hypothetical protein n=1 Tax=Leptospira noguchii TaxID=28182 RepID=UPI001F2E7691